ncbi:dehydrogenase [Streptosporangium violaceochromogenes]|nr:dehydrogenase [Streptosporangium violaceochromogenes]
MSAVRTALITGASSGIGRAAARRLAAEGYNLVVVARDEDGLRRLAADVRGRHPAVEVEVLPADLSTRAGRAPVVDRIRRASVPIDLLFNNAGLGHGTPATGNGVEAELRLLEVNTMAKVELMLNALQVMIPRGRGDIVNVSSVAAMGPAWIDSMYGPSTACVLAASEAMAYARRVRASGVRVMALCPGDTRTEFNARARIPDEIVPRWRWLSAERVVRAGLEDLRRGKAVSVPSARYRLLAFLLRHAPRRLAPLLAWDLGAYADAGGRIRFPGGHPAGGGKGGGDRGRRGERGRGAYRVRT